MDLRSAKAIGGEPLLGDVRVLVIGRYLAKIGHKFVTLMRARAEVLLTYVGIG